MLTSLRRVFYRALVVGVGEFLLACALVPIGARGAADAGYPLFALFLAVPAVLVTLVEQYVTPPGRAGPPRIAVAGLTLAVAAAGIFVAHFQAIYAGAVLETRSVPDGIRRAFEHWDELVVTGTGPMADVLFVFFLSLALPFGITSMLARDPRVTGRTRLVAVVLVTIVTALAQEAGRIYWSERILEHAAVVTSLSLPVFFALADALAPASPQNDEQNAK